MDGTKGDYNKLNELKELVMKKFSIGLAKKELCGLIWVRNVIRSVKTLLNADRYKNPSQNNHSIAI